MAAENKIYPPFHADNVAMQDDLKFCFEDTSEATHYKLRDVQDSNVTRGIFLSSHPVPCLQGPFPMPIGLSCLGVTFFDFTAYTHECSMSCEVWLPKLAGNFETKHERKHEVSKCDQILVGPSSTLNGNIVYCCSVGKCCIGCPCSLCTSPRESTCSKACLSLPCYKCETQCTDHKVGMPRTFNESKHLFTVVTKNAKANRNEKTIDLPKKNCIFVKYANIPKNCKNCPRDLQDHEVFHKVIHSRCKFCRFQISRLKDSVSIADIRETRNLLNLVEDDTCSICHKIFNRKYDRIVHEETAHCPVKVKCDVCERTFQSEKTKAKHMMVYHSNDLSIFECDVCGETVSTNDILIRHKKTVHQENSFCCKQCGLKFSRENYLKRHKSEVHGLISTINLNFASAKFQEFRRFKCEECGKAFTRKETMMRHKSIFHATKGPEALFKCKYCEKGFGRIDSLKRHQVNCKSSPTVISKLLVEELLNNIL